MPRRHTGTLSDNCDVEDIIIHGSLKSTNITVQLTENLRAQILIESHAFSWLKQKSGIIG